MRHVMAWRTDILKSWNGKERRAALLGTPRETFDIGYELDVAQLRLLRETLLRNPEEIYLIPLRQFDIAARADVTSTTIVADVTHAEWCAPGQRVYVENANEQGYTAVVQSVTPSTGIASIVLDATPPGAHALYAANMAGLSPLVPVYLEDNLPSGFYAVAAGRWRMRGHVAWPTAPTGLGATLVSHDGLPVLDRRLRIEEVAQENASAGIQVYDHGAAIETRWSRAVADVHRALEFFFDGAAERQYLRKFLAAVVGRQKPFLLPTWHPDLIVATQPTGTGLRVQAPPTANALDYLNDWFPSLAHRRLQLVMSDGTVIYRTVSGAIDNTDGTQTLTLTSGVDTSGASPDVSQVSFLETCRLGADEVEWRYDAGGVGVARFSAVVVQQ